MALQKRDVEATANAHRLRNVEMGLEALRNVIRNNPGMSLHLGVTTVSPTVMSCFSHGLGRGTLDFEGVRVVRYSCNS